MLLLTAAAPPFLLEIVAIVAAGAAIAYLCHRLGLVPIVGFLVAGVVIGPYGLGLVRDREMVDAAAEIGVILLLFTIGIEFSLGKLARIRRLILGGGGLQVGLATLATTLILLAFGVALPAAVFTGFLVSLSSTAIVLKLLADRGEMSSPVGQMSLAILIFQDVAVIVMVLLLPLLAGAGSGGGSGEIVFSLARAVALIGAVLLFARRLMPPLLERVQRTCSPELFLLTLVAICLGTAYLTSLAGVSLSLGAFLAGLLVSESRFSEHALGEILPLQILFSATFFVSVGMLLDLSFVLRHPLIVLGALVAVLVVKGVTATAAVAALGWRLPVAASTGLLLAQIGEFSFVLEKSGRDLGLTPAGLGETGSQGFIAATVVLMVLTPWVAAGGRRLSSVFERRSAEALVEAASGDPDAPPEVARLESHVILSGYGAEARRLVPIFAGSRIPFLVTTLNPQGAIEAEAQGALVLRGDSSRQGFLQHAGAERAKMMVIADDDVAMTRRIAAVARTINPTLRIVARARFVAEIEPLTEAGVDWVVAEELESLVAIFSEVLRSYLIPAEEIIAHEEAIRRGGYAALRAEEAEEGSEPAVVCRLGDDCFDTRTVTVRPGAPAAGTPWDELFLADFGLAATSLRRGSRVQDAPSGDLVLAPGDELTLRGTASAFAAAAPIFRAPAAEPPPPTPTLTPQPPPRYVDTSKPVGLVPRAGAACSHRGEIHPVVPRTDGCEECLAAGDRWVHLRLCMTCGHVGCCDTSPNKHATAHFQAAGHPVMRSLERGESWGWCYVDEVEL